MCQLCKKAVLRLHKKAGLGTEEAIAFLWSNTAFPVGDGVQVLGQVNQYLSVPKRNRKRWLAKWHRRAYASLSEVTP